MKAFTYKRKKRKQELKLIITRNTFLKFKLFERNKITADVNERR